MTPTPTDLQGAQAIQTALDLLGAGGARWTGGTGERGAAFTPDLSRGGFDYCVIGALIGAGESYDGYRAAYDAVKAQVGGNVARWNNRAETTFGDVQNTLRAARLNLLKA